MLSHLGNGNTVTEPVSARVGVIDHGDRVFLRAGLHANDLKETEKLMGQQAYRRRVRGSIAGSDERDLSEQRTAGLTGAVTTAKPMAYGLPDLG
jgi:hypothetical protein